MFAFETVLRVYNDFRSLTLFNTTNSYTRFLQINQTQINMRFSTSAIVACAFAFVAAQDLSNIPSCALPCFATAIQQSGCSLSDTKCQCTTGAQKITDSLTSCAPARCQGDDLNSTFSSFVLSSRQSTNKHHRDRPCRCCSLLRRWLPPLFRRSCCFRHLHDVRCHLHGR
jgi:hypothetical protein